MAPDLLDAVEIETAPAPAASIVWLHGLGADGHDFEGIVSELDLPPDLGIRFVFPHAPMRAVTINNGYVMRAWYDVFNDAGVRREDEPGVRAAQAMVEALIAREKARGVAAKNLVLAGFSQGGAMALHTGLRHPERIAGIMALSCFLPLRHTVNAEAHAANRDAPIFMVHGRNDPLIPMTRAEQGRDALIELGYRVEWREYAMPHAVCAEEIDDISDWLGRVLKRD